jgi:hypothetical protein
MGSARANLVKGAGIDDVAKKIAEQFATSDAMKELSRAWGKSLHETSAFKPETLTDIRAAQRSGADG